MKKHFFFLLLLLTGIFHQRFFAQNEGTKWYFGNQAGLDFMTNPPTPLSNGVMNAPDGCASIADGAGNLLFYTDGMTVYNRNHVIMANGTGLLGANYATQSAIIVKKPASATIYYIFTTGAYSNGFRFTTVDMSLAAGNGSVTVKNTFLINSYSEKVSAVRHCNGSDIWVLTRDSYWINNNVNNTLNFNAFLVSSAGVSLTPVISPANNFWNNNNAGYTYDYGCMKISPNGKKVAMALYNYWYLNNNNNVPYCNFELYDFNAFTGAVTNSLGLNPVVWNINNNYYNNEGYGVEFSPDGTKLYGSMPGYNNINNNGGLYQWDLCAGSDSAIVASQYTVATQNYNNVFNNWLGSLQVAPNGKIYGSRYGQTTLDVINNPNLAGAACGYVNAGQPLGIKLSTYSLPNFVSSFFPVPQNLAPFTYTVNQTNSCLTASFTAPTNPTIACAASGYAVSNFLWLFGDPGSGAANTSTINTPIHTYPTPGTYTVKLVYNYTCGSDTINMPVSIIGASLTVTTASITCASLGSATVSAAGGIGPFSYTWMPTAQTTSVATGLNPGTYSITVVDNGGNCAFTATTAFTSLVPFTGVVANSPSITCYGANTGTANIPVSGGSGNNLYYWTDGLTTQTTASLSNLGAGIHTITVIDALTSCSLTQFFYVSQPPALNINIAQSTGTACAGSSVSFTAANSGGTPGPGAGYTYTWSGGPPTDTYIVSQAAAGNYIYTVSSTDGNNCLSAQTVSVNFIVNPVISVPVVSICPLQTGTLVATGATSYTWNNGSNGNTLADNPMVTTVYTVTGSALGCLSAPKTATISLKTVPSPTITSNSPVCNGQKLILTGSGGNSYVWTGPQAFTSSLQSSTINPAAPNNSGAYNLTVTAANSCTAPATTTLTVNPTPTVSTSGSTVCTTQTLMLYSNTFAGASYLWSGPGTFTSSVQNPTLASSATSLSGAYNLTVTSVVGCTNTASASASVVALPVPVITANYTAMCFGSSLSLAGSGGVAYAWSGPASFNSSSQNTGINNISLSANGVYTLTVTTGPCVVSTTKSITIYPLPNPVASSIPACETKSLQISTTSGGGTSFAWTGPAAFTSTLQNPVLNNVSVANAGVYNVIVTDANNCQNTTSVPVTILLNPVISVTNASVCIARPAIVTASGALTYAWTGPLGFTASSDTALIYSANSAAPQPYLVTGTAANSCTGIAVAIVNTIPLPSPSLTTTARACLNSTISLAGWGGTIYQWNGPNNFFSDRQQVTFKVSNIEFNGTYTLTVTDNTGCQNFTTTAIVIDPAPEADLTVSNNNHCVPFCSDYVMSAKAGPAITGISWEISGQLFSGTSFNYCASQPGNYLVSGTFTNAMGCSNTNTFEISAYPLPVADFAYTPAHPVEGLDEVSFTNLSKGQQLSKWNWYFINNRGYQANTENTAYLFENAGTYPVSMVVRNSWGCMDTIVKTVTVENDFNIYVPNSFTPNDDGKNDVFQPKGRGVASYHLMIYDRWGERIFETSDFLKAWDGTFLGQPCKTEVYVWKITVSDIKGKSKNMNGFVTLYR